MMPLPLGPIDNLMYVMTILLVVFIIGPLIISLFLAIWIYKDAKKREMNAIIWVLIAWLFPYFIGFIVYLIVRDKS
jgi:hypothetical protein